MYVLRLQKEWQMVTKNQYQVDLNPDGTVKTNHKVMNKSIDSDMCIKLLCRCVRMYDAKTSVTRILKTILEKDKLAGKLYVRASMNSNEA